MQVSLPYPNLLHFDYPNRREVALSFIRIQEFYESKDPDLKWKHFTLEDIIAKCTDEDGCFDYFTAWSGFNVPGVMVDEFFATFRHLTNREEAIYREIHTHVDVRKPYYIIGSHGNDKAVFNHEYAHAMYYLNPDYRGDAFESIWGMSDSVKNRIFKKFEKLGYHEDVFEDELQAYLATASAGEIRSTLGVPFDSVKKQATELRRLFKNYSSGV